MRKIGTGILWIITILMLSSVTIFNPGQVTDFFVTLFNIKPSIPELKPIEISERDREIRSIAESITQEDVRQVITDLSGMGSRVPAMRGTGRLLNMSNGILSKLGSKILWLKNTR